jgi:ATP-dependent RNA helicase SUPV3L1/SUV3
VEGHSFEPLAYLHWRNSGLDFTSIDALLAGLLAPPPAPVLVRGNEATDLATLASLARDPEIRALARGRSRIRALWDACQIPDFRKIADDSHARLCARVFTHAVKDGAIPTDWIAGAIAGLTRADGDIDTLMQRLAGVRVWSYIAARSDWLRDAAHWQARAREAEDMVSDALHEKLIARFVDRRAALLMRRLEPGAAEALLSAVTRQGEVVVEGHPVGHIAGFAFHPDPATEGEERKLVLRAARRALAEEIPRRVARLEAGPDSAFRLALPPEAPTPTLLWEGHPVAILRPGASPLRPLAEVRDTALIDGAQRERIRVRLQRFLDAQLRAALAPLFAAAESARVTPALRGVLHRVAEGLGVAPALEPDHDLSPDQRRALKAMGVRAGRQALFMPAMLKPAASLLRAALWALPRGLAAPALPPPGLVSLVPPPDWPEGFAAAMGWVEAGPALLRLDIAERVGAELAWACRARPAPLPPDLPSRLSLRAELVPAVLRRMGLRLMPAAALPPGAYGPPAPAMITPLRRRRAAAEPAAPPRAEGPFSALAQLRPGRA